MVFAEYLAFLLSFVVLTPFEWLWMSADRLRPCKTPILLVHGYGCSRAIWWKMRRELEAAGHTVATVSLTPPYTSVGKLVPQLAQRIDEVCAACDAQQVILIAHSMGGLVSRSFIARHGIAQVEQLITFASPHQGSELARLGFGQNAREMEPDSLWLNDLAQESVKVPFVSIRTSHDNYVMPQDNQRLPEAEDIELPVLGHLAALYSLRTTKAILSCIGQLK
jgi:triacylglycerol lipase